VIGVIMVNKDRTWAETRHRLPHILQLQG
jgi:hypothetical protein